MPDKEKIIEKLNEGEVLTREEELFYLVEILGHSEQEAKTIMTIAENGDPNRLID